MCIVEAPSLSIFNVISGWQPIVFPIQLPSASSLSGHFQFQGNCMGHLVGMNLSPNNWQQLRLVAIILRRVGEGLQITAIYFKNTERWTANTL